MNALYFLKLRTSFIRYFYDESVKSFRKIQNKIENNEPPFDNPPYIEDPEPPYLEEWCNAGTGVDLLGQLCISVLSDTLKLYFQTLEKRVIGFNLSQNGKVIAKKQGFVAAYKAALGQILDTDWAGSGVRFDVIEQVVVARNRSQHGNSLTSFDIEHDRDAISKYPRPFFVSETELQTWDELSGGPNSLFLPSMKITRSKLFFAIEEIEKLADWIEGKMRNAGEWRQNAASK